MKQIYAEESSPETPKILLKPATAAAALSMSRTTLEANLYPAGAKIPWFRLGSRLYLEVSALKRWASQQTTRQECEADLAINEEAV